MEADVLVNRNINCIRLLQIIKAEGRKARDTQIAKAILIITVCLTCIMFGVSIFLLKDISSWTDTYGLIAGPATTILGVLFIIHVCEEWTRGTALVTYTFVPKRSRVFFAKFIVLISYYIITVIILLILSMVSAMFISEVGIQEIWKNNSLNSIIDLVLPLLINLLFAFSLAVAIQETTIVIGMYFVIPPITVLVTQLPDIGQYLKWFSLEHSSSIFIAGATGISRQQYLCSIIVWIIIPSIIGVIRSIKRDIN